MQRRKTPAFDPRVAPAQGVTKDGQPLSYNRAPSPGLAPWIARIYVTKVDLPCEATLSCGLFNDTACIRVQLAGEWTALTATGPEAFGHAALFFGPQSHRMPVAVKGSFVSLGIALRPGACFALKFPPAGEWLDRLAPIAAIAPDAPDLLGALASDGTAEDWADTLEAFIARRVEQVDGALPDPVSAMFEEITLREPGTSVSDAAIQCGVERRRLERIVRRNFGMPPKQVLRRARALDMASHLRGVADSDESEEIALRYYDESHLIHEFTELFGMAPGPFVATPQPILTLALESRQARRLEALNRIAPGQSRPWE